MATTTNFGWALANLKSDLRVARQGWNGKGMWLELVKSEQVTIVPEKYDGDSVALWAFGDKIGGYGDQYQHYGLLPWIGMKTADDKFVPWLASQTDLLAEDWVVVNS